MFTENNFVKSAELKVHSKKGKVKYAEEKVQRKKGEEKFNYLFWEQENFFFRTTIKFKQYLNNSYFSINGLE